MSHILGYVGQISQRDLDNPQNQDELGYPVYDPTDSIGKDGLELDLESTLRGERGRRIIEMDASGSSWRVVPDSTIEPIPGKNVALTIDLELQRAASEILRAGIAYSNADRHAIERADPTRRVKQESGAGAVVALDPRTGEVLAMVSFPHYDNQLFVDGISQRKYQEYASEEANKPLVDRALRGEYPAGSTIKPFLAAAALQEGKLTLDKTYTCTGAIQVPFAWDESKGNTHPCWAWRLGGHQALDVYDAIEQSCDVFFYNVGAPRQPLDESKSDYLHYRDKNVAGKHLGREALFRGARHPADQEEPDRAVLVRHPDRHRAANRSAGRGAGRGMAGPHLPGHGVVGRRHDQRLDRPGLLPDDAAAARLEHRGIRQWRQDPQAAARARHVRRPTIRGQSSSSRPCSAKSASARSTWMSRARACAGSSMAQPAPPPAAAVCKRSGR